MSKPALGFPTQKELNIAVKSIVNRYNLYSGEFYHPLLERLFLERPYWPEWCNALPVHFTKFKWVMGTVPNGGTTERYFMAWSEKTGWIAKSLNKAIKGERLTLRDILERCGRDRVARILSQYRNEHPLCEFDECVLPSQDVHHLKPMREIWDEVFNQLSIEELDSYKILYEPFSSKGFALPNNSKFITLVLQHHHSSNLKALCKDHHYAIEGKKRRKEDVRSADDGTALRHDGMANLPGASGNQEEL
jgi:hypothetical protein